jgi:hypothetical protein
MLLFAGASSSTPSGSGPTLSVQGDAAAGHVTLQWQAAKEGEDAAGTEFLLQESSTEDFSDARIRYQGQHHSSVLSGLLNGSYHFRVRSRPADEQPWGAWSAPQVFKVKHHSLPLAFTLFGIGAAVFGLTLAFLLVSARKASS